jgi:SAM-dependent methyltransferase
MSSDNDWWDRRYREESTPWDLGEPAGPLLEVLDTLEIRPPARVLVPGCGRGHDAIALARRGFEVTAFDFAPSAVADARALSRAAGQEVLFLQADLFQLPKDWQSQFDLLFEHTCLVVLDPARRQAYVRIVHGLLAESRHLLGLFFPVRAIGESGPPFPITEHDIDSFFGEHFELLWKKRPTLSAPSRDGNEFLALLQKRSPKP